MEINHNQATTISTYSTKDTSNLFQFRKSSSAAAILNITTQRKYEAKLNYPTNLTILTPIKMIKILPEMKLRFNESNIIRQTPQTRNIRPNLPFNFKSFDCLKPKHNHHHIRTLTNPQGFNDLQSPNKIIKVHRKPFDNNKYVFFSDKQYCELKQQLSENCVLIRNEYVNNRNYNDNSTSNSNANNSVNIRLSKNKIHLSSIDNNKQNVSEKRAVSDSKKLLLKPERDKYKENRIETNVTINKKELTLTPVKDNNKDKDKDKCKDKEQENEIERRKDTKRSDVKTDTDSKERHSNNNIISETSRLTNNTGVNVLIANDLHYKNHKSSKSIIFNTKTKRIEDGKNMKILDFITLPKTKAYRFHLQFPKMKTGNKLIDSLTDNISQSLTKVNNSNFKNKRKFLWTNIDQLKVKHISRLDYEILNHKSSATLVQTYINLFINNPRSDFNCSWEINFKFLEFQADCKLSLPMIYYLNKLYLAIDSFATEDYLFNIKSNLFQNYALKRMYMPTRTKKTTIFQKKEVRDNDYPKTRLLYLQRFIQNDFNLGKLKHMDIEKEFNEEFKLFMNKPPKNPRKKDKSNHRLLAPKYKANDLSILKKRRFFVLENEINTNRKDVFLHQQSIKDINVSLLLPEVKKLIIDLNDCFIMNKCNYNQDSTNEIISAFLSPPLLFDLFVKLISCNAFSLIDRCLKYKSDFDLDVQNLKGNTLLIIAVKSNIIAVVQYLLEKGANTNNYGNTAMHYAVAHKNLRVVDLLTQHGGRQDILNNDNNTPWECVNRNLEHSE